MKVPFLISAAILLVTSAVSASRGNFGPTIHHGFYLTPGQTCGLDAFSNPSDLKPLQVAHDFVRSHITNSDYYIQSSYTDAHNGVTHVYLKQLVGGFEVVNGDININVDNRGRVISFGDSFYHGKNITLGAVLQSNVEFERLLEEDVKQAVTEFVDDTLDLAKDKINQFVFGGFESHDNSLKKRQLSAELEDYSFGTYSTSKLTPIEALRKFIASECGHFDEYENLVVSETTSLQNGQPVFEITGAPFALSPIPVVQKYLQTEAGDLELVWDMQIEMENNWFHTQVGAYTGEILARMDWVADAAYNVYGFGQNDPSDGDARLIENPSDKVASPDGWHTQKRHKFNTTVGNNVYAHDNSDGGWQWEDNYRPDGGDDLIFDFPVEPATQDPKEYLDAAIVNLFYWNNMIHDLFYRYGFDEAAGNFQEHNYGPDGKGNDAVIANAQDGSGFNNANFATPPDGQHGKMRMYIWDQTDPRRDGDLESGIVVHEYAHGISTRLTGGPENSGCLGWGEAGGMGEGWGDFFATIFRMKPDMNRTIEFGMGDWANGGEGIRKYKYSTSNKTNPETYKSMDKPGYWGVHAQGAVWAEMLYEVYWNMVDKHGFTSDYIPPLPKDHEKMKPEEIAAHAKEHITSHGNTLILQLVVDGMKLQPCRPSFVNARDAILHADKVLTGGENACEIWAGFAKRGLGKGAKLEGGSPWGGGVRKESTAVPHKCKGEKDDEEEIEDFFL